MLLVLKLHIIRKKYKSLVLENFAIKSYLEVFKFQVHKLEIPFPSTCNK